ncbi:hypothetical protein EMCRGX_G033544 [Ephydatia muelleri]|eukprot:Em0022g706a
MKKERGYSLVIVVTPLVSIMEDQVATYCSKGLTSICVSGDTSGSAILNDVSLGKYQLVFFTPEIVLASKKWRKVIQGDVYNERLRAFVIDEAHCVKKW